MHTNLFLLEFALTDESTILLFEIIPDERMVK